MTYDPNEPREPDVEELRRELDESKEMVRALMAGEVDAVATEGSTPTLLREAQRAMREREQLFRAVFDGAMDCMLVADDDGRYVDANSAACEVFGVPKEELLGRSVADFAEPDFDFDAAWRAFLEQGRMRGEMAIVRPDGERRTLGFAATASIIPGRHLSVLRDVTEERRAVKAREQAERHLATVVGGTPVILFAANAEGRFTMAEGKGLDALGVTSEQLVGTSMREEYGGRTVTLTDGTKITGRDVYERAMEGQTVQGIAEPAEDRYFDTVYQPLRDEAGQVVGVHGVAVDVTERVRAERELEQREEQLRQAQRMESIGRLAGGIAHDFNNVLAAITGFGEFLRDDLGVEDPRREDAEQILEAADRASTLTKQLLAFGRKQVLKPETFELNDLVESVRRMLRRIIGEDVLLETDLAEATGYVHADRGQLEQVLVNLAVNARDAMPQGGRLTLGTDVRMAPAERVEAGLPAGRYAVVSVTDTGVGMDEATRARMFEPFFTTKERGKGTGLGLATVYGIVKQTGGDIAVQSEPGEGTRFDIYLPRTGKTAVTTSRPPVGPGSFAGAHETVLVVEDEPVVRHLVEQILERNGYQPLVADDPAEAERLFEAHADRIDLVLSDVVMPDMLGPALVQRLRARRPDLPAVFVSGYAEDASEHALEEAELVIKPFGPRTLLEALRRALDGPSE